MTRSLAVAESCTGGLLGAAIVAVPGASAFFRGGVIAYTLDAKVQLLGVDRDHAASVDCVSPRVAREMARGARALFDADVGVSTTGFAAPGGGQIAFCAVDYRDGVVESFTVQQPLGRNAFRALVVEAAMARVPRN